MASTAISPEPSFASCQSTPGTTPCDSPVTGVGTTLPPLPLEGTMCDRMKESIQPADAAKRLFETISPTEHSLPALELFMKSRSDAAKTSCQWLARRVLASYLFDRNTFRCKESWIGPVAEASIQAAVDQSLPLLLCIVSATSDHTDEQPWLDDDRIETSSSKHVVGLESEWARL